MKQEIVKEVRRLDLNKWWYHPESDTIINVPNHLHHMNMIIDDPETFGTSREEINQHVHMLFTLGVIVRDKGWCRCTTSYSTNEFNVDANSLIAVAKCLRKVYDDPKAHIEFLKMDLYNPDGTTRVHELRHRKQIERLARTGKIYGGMREDIVKEDYPLNYKFWYNTRIKQVVEIEGLMDHTVYVTEYPEKFGYTDEQIQQYKNPKNRFLDGTLANRLLFPNNWVRVIFHQGRAVANIHTNNLRDARLTSKFLIEKLPTSTNTLDFMIDVDRYTDKTTRSLKFFKIDQVLKFIRKGQLPDFQRTGKLIESVVLPSNLLFPYAVVVAEAYDRAPLITNIAIDSYKALAASNEKLFKKVVKKLDVEFIADDSGFADIMRHYQSGRLPVWGGSKSSHPFLSDDQNRKFRAVHDYFTHISKNIAVPPERQMTTHGFNMRGELNTVLVHAKLVPPKAIPALFCEVVGQLCYKIVTGDFPVQKAAILDGFDFRNIGQMSPYNKLRFDDVVAQLNNPEVDVIYTTVKGHEMISKQDIPWIDIAPSMKKSFVKETKKVEEVSGSRVPLEQDVIDAFTELGSDQRGDPEEAMVRAQHVLGGGLMSFAIEHTGDITHRMSHMAQYGRHGREYVVNKAEKVLRVLTQGYGFEREHNENMEASANHRDIPLERQLTRVDAMLNVYANEHRKLTVYNRPQWLAREAAVALGEKKYIKAARMLRELLNIAQNGELYQVEAFRIYRGHNSGDIIPYTPPVTESKIMEGKVIKAENDDTEFVIIRNPTKTQYRNLRKKVPYQSLRGLLRSDGKELFIWGGEYALHHTIKELLGLDFEFFDYDSHLDDMHFDNPHWAAYDDRLVRALHEGKVIKLDVFNRSFRVIKNPTKVQYDNMKSKTPFGTLRGMLRNDGKELYIWPAVDSDHWGVSSELGLNHNNYIHLHGSEFGNSDHYGAKSQLIYRLRDTK